MTSTHIRPTTSDLAGPVVIDGVPARQVCRPDAPQQVADILRQASGDGESVFPVGSGLHQSLGRIPESVDLVVSTRGLAGLIRYDPEDLVVSVRAGTTLADLQAELASNGQWLPVEAPGGSDATIGGMLALGLTGPRQLGSLSLRDLLLGMVVAQTDGTLARSGGMVVKNVTGFDMGRLHVGARGTLGVITSANFKVLPKPETEATIIVSFGDAVPALSEAFAAFGRIRAGILRPVAAEVIVGDGQIRLAVRFEGRAGSVQRQLLAARDVTGGDLETLTDPEAGRQWWECHVTGLGFDDPRETVLRFDTRPRSIADAAGQVLEAVRRQAIPSARLVSSPGLGQLWLHLGEAPPEPVLALVADLRRLPGAVTVLSAPTAWKANLDPRPSDDARPVDAALREQFDPNGILNRGRFPLG